MVFLRSRFYAQPEGLGVCSFAAKYEDSDEGWDRAEAFFVAIDEAKAIELAKPLYSLEVLGETTKGTI